MGIHSDDQNRAILSSLAAAFDEGECLIDEETAAYIAADLRRLSTRLNHSLFSRLVLSSIISIYAVLIGLPWPVAALIGPVVVRVIEWRLYGKITS